MWISVKMADSKVSLTSLVQCGMVQTHCAVHSSLCMGSEGTETVRNGFLSRVFRFDSLLHPRGSYVRGLFGLAICRWSKSFEVSWKVVRIRRKWRTHSTCCNPHAILFPYFDPSSLLSPLLDIPRFRHFNTWKQKMQCSDTTSSQVLLSVLATVLKIAIKMHKSKSFSRLFQWRKRKKKRNKHQKQYFLLKQRFLQLYILETLRPLFSIPTEWLNDYKESKESFSNSSQSKWINK